MEIPALPEHSRWFTEAIVSKDFKIRQGWRKNTIVRRKIENLIGRWSSNNEGDHEADIVVA